MGLSRIDCEFYYSSDLEQGAASYVACNPSSSPGTLVIAGSTVVSPGIGGRIACRLCLDHFMAGVLDCFAIGGVEEGLQSSSDGAAQRFSSRVLQVAFKGANRGVYEYSHKLGATGQMQASLFGLVVQDGMATTGRAGAWSGYLLRSERVFPFFEHPSRQQSLEIRESLVGMRPKIMVETASWPLEGEDSIAVFSRYLAPEHETMLGEEYVKDDLESCAELVERLFVERARPAVGFVVSFGPEAVYLGSHPAAGCKGLRGG